LRLCHGERPGPVSYPQEDTMTSSRGGLPFLPLHGREGAGRPRVFENIGQT
jgi:hypothetical protein